MMSRRNVEQLRPWLNFSYCLGLAVREKLSITLQCAVTTRQDVTLITLWLLNTQSNLQIKLNGKSLVQTRLAWLEYIKMSYLTWDAHVRQIDPISVIGFLSSDFSIVNLNVGRRITICSFFPSSTSASLCRLHLSFHATTVQTDWLNHQPGLIWSEVKQLWDVGLQEYIHDMWNVIDFITNSLYVATVALRVVSYFQVSPQTSHDKRLLKDCLSISCRLQIGAKRNGSQSVRGWFATWEMGYVGPDVDIRRLVQRSEHLQLT